MLVDRELNKRISKLADKVWSLNFGSIRDRFESLMKLQFKILGADFEVPEQERVREFLLELLLIYQEGLKRYSWFDGVGYLWETIGLSNPKVGQFFTPPTVVDFMAISSFYPEEIEKVNEKEGRNYNFLDPASGSGRFSLSFWAAVREFNEKHNKNLRVSFTSVDIDYTAFLMTSFNYFVYNIEGVVFHGNTLTNDCWSVAEVKRFLGIPTIKFYGCKKLPFELKEEEVKKVEEFKESKIKEAKQLKLF